MKVICGTAVAESFAVAPGFTAPELPADDAPAVAGVRGSKVATASRDEAESGFPRRNRGRFGSAMGSSGSGAGAGAFEALGGAGVVVVVVVGLVLAGGAEVGDAVG